MIDSCVKHFTEGNGRNIRSFVAIPLFDIGLGDSREPIGILNLQSSATDIFGANDVTVNNFRLSISPLLYMLERVLTSGKLSASIGMLEDGPTPTPKAT